MKVKYNLGMHTILLKVDIFVMKVFFIVIIFGVIVVTASFLTFQIRLCVLPGPCAITPLKCRDTDTFVQARADFFS